MGGTPFGFVSAAFYLTDKACRPLSCLLLIVPFHFFFFGFLSTPSSVGGNRDILVWVPDPTGGFS